MSPRPAIRAGAALCWATLLVACRDPSAPRPGAGAGPGERASGPGTALLADPAGRLVVAEVDGAPVYGDCVATQMAAHEIDREHALRECIRFELLAQEAGRRGLAGHPDVRWAQRVEIVRHLIDTDFVARFPNPDSMDRALLEEAYAQLIKQYVRPELRHVAHAWVPVDESEPPGSARDQAARALAGEIHAALENRRDLAAEELFETAESVAGDREVEHEGTFSLHRQSRLAESFIEATFALPGPGMVSPPVRSHIGWHIVLLTQIDPEVNVSLDEAKPELFEVQRKRQFLAWLSRLVDDSSIRIDDTVLARVQESEEQERFAAPVSP